MFFHCMLLIKLKCKKLHKYECTKHKILKIMLRLLNYHWCFEAPRMTQYMFHILTGHIRKTRQYIPQRFFNINSVGYICSRYGNWSITPQMSSSEQSIRGLKIWCWAPQHIPIAIPDQDPEGRPPKGSVLLVFQAMTSLEKQNQG